MTGGVGMAGMRALEAGVCLPAYKHSVLLVHIENGHHVWGHPVGQ